ncbi:agmatinase [Nitrospirales bacterium NOB]|nr:N(1)-aminopropylagmatine ureohydrolase [Nitrospirota bacterium]MCE7966256.1 agmatinase [Nitrospira sp. NTP2]MCK6491912.1 agmatinase [Nitrospira sp.]MDL1889416.1 agmatinase [Nitrospirales bacterium NOB]MEB2339929.1 agmatinase [Nitrospirales bacterium]
MTLPSGWLGQSDNFLGIDEPWCHPDQAGVYVLPAPYEHTSSYILGSDQGPSAIIEASQQVELYDETVKSEPYRDWGGVATHASVQLEGRVDGAAVEAIQSFVQPHVGQGKFLVTLTGEHTGALGAIRAHARAYPGMCVLQIDAHGDLRQAYQGNPYSHASVMARVVQDGLPLVQVGVRSISSEEIDLIERTPRIKTFLAASILDPSGPYEGRAARWIPEVVAACSGPVYLTFDCDGLDASLVPALGTPEPGGLGWYDTLALITALANGPGIVGMDISEIAPIEGFVAPQFCIARLIYRMLGRIRAGRRVH